MEKLNGYDFTPSQVGYISECIEPVSGNLTLRDVIPYFEESPEMEALPIELSDGIGILCRRDVMQKKGSLVSGGRTIASMDNLYREGGSISSKENVKKVLREVTEDKDRDYFVIFQESSFFGILSLRNLIKHISQLQDEETSLSREIQDFILGKNVFNDNRFSITPHQQLAHDLGGDYYYCTQLNSEQSMVSCFDVKGHNSIAMQISVMIDSFFKTRKLLDGLDDKDPEKTILSLNSFLVQNTPEDLTVGALFLFISGDTLQVYNFQYTTPFLILLEDGAVKAKMPASQFDALGSEDIVLLRDKPKEYSLKSLKHIFIYSDGLELCQNAMGKTFGMENIRTCLIENFKSLGEGFSGILEKKVSDFRKDTPLLDDITTLEINFN